MPRERIRDFSGGLVTNQSEFDISTNQFQELSTVDNTKRGSLVKANLGTTQSGALSGYPIATAAQMDIYRTEKDASSNDNSTEWWILGSSTDVSRSDQILGTSSTWSSINTYSSGSVLVTNGNFSGSSDWVFGNGWTRVVGESSVYANSDGVSAGTLRQASTSMVSPLKKNKNYILSFSLSNISGTGKASISITNYEGDETYVSDSLYTAVTVTLYFSPKKSNQGFGFFAATSTGTPTESFRLDDISIRELPNYDFLIHNQILRISDSSFNSSNDPKWYGHIKRNFFGAGITYSSSADGFRFRRPSMQVGKDNWVSEKTVLTAPIVVPMKYAFDQNNDIDAANEVGIFVHFPSGSATDLELIPSASSDTFKAKDKYTVTFIYDYVQESVLGRDVNDDIGVYAQNAPDSDGQHCPGIQLVLFTNTSGNFTGGTGWNQRITGINLYWQPEDDVDWYLVTTYDCNDGFSDDPRAKDSTVDVVLRTGATIQSNNGYWIPCMEPYGATSSDFKNIASATATTFTNDSTTYGSTFALNNMVFVYPDDSISSLEDVAEKLKETSTIICNIKSKASQVLTTGIVSGTVEWKNWSGEGNAQTPFSMSSARAFAATVSTDKVATWYLPNDGLKLSTYNSLTGRASSTKLAPLSWGCSTVVGNKAFYANIDFEDENSQTLREKNRIVFTSDYKLDETTIGTKFIDVGRNDGDEIISLQPSGNRLYVFKTNNIYIYRILSSQGSNFTLERHISGIGSHYKNSIIKTPYGLCFADDKQISLIRGLEVTELSFAIQDTYQSLSGTGGEAIGYDSILNTLYYSYSKSEKEMYAYNFNSQSWYLKSTNIFDQNVSNIVLSSKKRAQAFLSSSKKVGNIADGTGSTQSAIIKTKRYDFSLPDQFKRFTKIHCIYLSSSIISVDFYIDGDSSSALTLSLDSKSTLDVESSFVNLLGKSIEIKITSTATNFRLDGIDLDYDVEGANP